MITGHLEPEWIEQAEATARMRIEWAIRAKAAGSHGFEGERSALNRQGAWGEAFVGQTYGLEWSHTGEVWRRHEADIGPLDVRSTEVRPANLLIRPGDPDERIFVAVHVPKEPRIEDELQISGWDYAGLCKVEAYLWHANNRNRPPVYILPWGALRFPSALFDVLGKP